MNKMDNVRFDSHDKLNRKDQAFKISNILNESEKYTENDEGLVIALNSPWGTGKTMFLKMWENEINATTNVKNNESISQNNSQNTENENKIKNIDDELNESFPLCKEETNTLYYNAWEHDDYDNPLIPLIAHLNTVFKKAILREKLKDESIKELSETLKNWGKAATSLAFRVGGNIIKKKLGLDKIDFNINELLNFKKSDFNKFLELEDKFENIGIDDIEEELGRLSSKTKEKYLKIKSAVEPELFEDFENFKRIKKEFRKTLKNISKDKKLIIFVDELDRCRPLYAIETLEAIKHFFSVPNVVFVLSVDIEQLSHSIATVYGQNMDSEGYLMRFVDMQFKLPDPSIDIFCDFLNQKKESSFIFEDKNLICIKSVFKEFNLSLRDMKKIFLNISLLQQNLDKDIVEDDEAFMFYISLFILKYKDGKAYNLILKTEIEKDLELEKYIKKYKTRSRLNVLISSKSMEILKEHFSKLTASYPMYFVKHELARCKKSNNSLNFKPDDLEKLYQYFKKQKNYISRKDLNNKSTYELTYIQYVERKLEFVVIE